MKYLLFLVVLATSRLLAEEVPTPNAPAEIQARYKLIWHDEFDGTQLDKAKWQHVTPGKPRKEGFNDPDCAALDGEGHLRITIKQVGEEYHSGMISTQGKFGAQYGYYECRARLQTEVGFWSAFWLHGAHVNAVDFGAPDDPAKNGVECDVFEYLASHPDGFQHAMHWSGYGQFHKHQGFRIKAPEVSADWHTYGVEWRVDGYTFYLDGKKTWEFNGAVSQTMQFLVLSAEVGPWAGDIKQANLPAKVEFDYVRVWQEPATAAVSPLEE